MLNTKLLGSVSSPPAIYPEDVFSTFLYTGNGTSQTINNGLDLAGKGGLTWIKARTAATFPDHWLWDTARQSGGNQYALQSNTTSAELIGYTNNIAWTSTGFDYSTSPAGNQSGQNYCSWSFREQAKFFDVVTYTGNSVAGRVINHNLGSAPGAIIVKTLNAVDSWLFWHRSIANNGYARLNSTAAAVTTNTQFKFGNGTTTVVPDATSFTVGDDGDINSSGTTYVAYLFAHNAGGFGASGTDNVISCGSFTTATSTLDVTLGYEPQYVMFKRTDDVGDWQVYDNMRGFPNGRRLSPNTSAAEDAGASIQALATGFNVNTTYNATFIYMAIRRPMKPPTSGTEVFSPVARTGNGSTASITGINFAPDVLLCSSRAGYWEASFNDRLRGFDRTLYTQLTTAESTNATSVTAMGNTSISLGAFGSVNASGQTYINWILRRAAGFFDEVCYTGTAYPQPVVNHNLGVVPELIIVKRRNGTSGWAVYSKLSGSSNYVYWSSTGLNGNTAATGDIAGSPYITSTTIDFDSIAVSPFTGTAGATNVIYLFATLAGVSKVFSFTGNGSSQTINCGFTAGARFVMIKRTDSTGDWYIWDTARGIVSGNDPHLSLNTTAAEVTSNDSIDPDNSGFIVNQLSATNINVSSATYIGIAIA